MESIATNSNLHFEPGKWFLRFMNSIYWKRLNILKLLTLSLRRIFYFFLIELQYLRQHLTCFVDTAEPMPFTLISNIRETNEFYSKINQKCFRGSFLASRMFRKDPTCMVQEVALNKI